MYLTEYLNLIEIAEQQARALCPSDFIKQLRVIKPQRVLLSTAILWCQLLVAWLVALLGPKWLCIPAFVVICACISGMQLWVHESAHFSLFRHRKLNDIWASIFFASPIGMSVKTYRRFHMTHHAHLSTTTDRDRFVFNVDIKGVKKVLRVLLGGLLCIEGYRIVMEKYLGPKDHISEKNHDWSFWATMIWNALLLFSCILAGRYYLYFMLWVYPILAVVVTINSLRSIGEHQPVDFEGPVPNDKNITPIIRTTLPGFLEKWLMFQANFNYHFEHHLYPTIPEINLPILNKHLIKSGFYQKNPELIQKSAIAKVFALSRGMKRGKRDAAEQF